LFVDGDCVTSSNASVTGSLWCAGGCMEQLEFLTQNCTGEKGEYANQMLSYCGPCWQKAEAVQYARCDQPADAAMCEWCEMEVGYLVESCKDEYAANSSYSMSNWAESIKSSGEYYCQNMNKGPKCMKIGIETAKCVGAIFC